MTQQVQTDVKSECKAKQAEDVQDTASSEQSAWQAAPAAQHAPRKFTPRQMIQMQRTVGNRAASAMMQSGLGKGVTAPPTIQHHAANQPLQRTTATVKGKSFGKTSIRNAANQIVAKVAKNTVLDVDESTTRRLGAKDYYRLNVDDEDVDVLFTEVTSLFGDEVYIEVDAVTVSPVQQDGEAPEEVPEEESDPAALEIELFEGHKFTLTPKGGKLEGEIEESLSAPLPAVDVSIDIPIPAAPGVYISAGLAITPKLEITATGSYALEKTSEETTFDISGVISGSTGLTITAKGLVGVGLANVAGLSAGLFAEASGEAELKGTLAGKVAKRSDKSWGEFSLKLDIEAEASIVGAVGAMLEAKLGPLTASKKYKLGEKEFAHFDWKRPMLDIQKAGAKMSDLIPKLSDFEFVVKKDSESPLTEINERTPLLSSDSLSS